VLFADVTGNLIDSLAGGYPRVARNLVTPSAVTIIGPAQ